MFRDREMNCLLYVIKPDDHDHESLGSSERTDKASVKLL